MFANSKLIKQTYRNGKPYSAMLDWMYDKLLLVMSD